MLKLTNVLDLQRQPPTRQHCQPIQVRMQSPLDDTYENSVLEVDPVNPSAAKEHVLDTRRRFFDAMTLPS